MQQRVARKRAGARIDLDQRAAQLAARYGLPRPASITWSERQQQRWGSCTPGDRSIRISTRMAQMPAWVLDYVIVHELAHLVESGHGPAFKTLVDRYPKAERARGYLIAKAEQG
jgi:predicted metal-dependent hydrolase